MTVKRSNGQQESYFSADPESHLKKIGSNQFRSVALIIVELIRSAIKRDPKTVKVQIKKKRIIIEDDGNGIAQNQITLLNTVFDIKREADIRERAIQEHYEQYNIDLLVLYGFSRYGVSIETSSDSGGTRLFFNRKTLTQSPSSLIKGTRIIINRDANVLNDELKIVNAYCKLLGNRLIINGIPQREIPAINGLIVSTKSENKQGDWKIETGITQNGEHCKFWIYSYGILKYVKTYSPVDGYIFETAVEVDGDLNDQIIKESCDNAKRLYQWMTERLDSYPEETRLRLKTLVFEQFKVTQNQDLLKKLRAFETVHNGPRFNIVQMAASRQIYAVEKGDDISKYNTSGKTVFILDKNETDILTNSFGIQIKFLHPIQDIAGLSDSIVYRILFRMKKILSRLQRRFYTEIPDIFLSESESTLKSKICDSLKKGNYLRNEFNTEPEIIFYNSRFLLPAFIGKESEIVKVYIGKKHRKIKRYETLVNRDEKNIEWILPTLLN